MTINAIDSGRIEAMLAQLKAAAQKPASESTATKSGAALANIQANQETKRVDFSDALKSSLDNVNKMQIDAESMGKNFAMGDDKVSLSDVMIAGQKANISFQATIQVRNKLVSAYHDIMNMAI